MPIIEGSVGRGDTSALTSDAPELIALAGQIPTADPGDIGTSTDLPAVDAHDATTPLVHHTATSAIAGSYADLAAARTSVNTLRTEVENALAHTDTFLDDFRTELEAVLTAFEANVQAIVDGAEDRLDTIESKFDELIGGFRDAAIIA
jgi:hypothetical protein